MQQPEKLTKKQLELLVLIFPGPIGKGLSITKAAKVLGISRRAAHYRLSCFKKNNPEAHQNYEDIKKLKQIQRKNLEATFVGVKALERFSKKDLFPPYYVQQDMHYMEQYNDTVKINFEEYERDVVRGGKSYYNENKIKEKF